MSDDAPNPENWFAKRKERIARLQAIAEHFQSGNRSDHSDKLKELQDLQAQIRSDFDTRPTKQEMAEYWKAAHEKEPGKSREELTASALRATVEILRDSGRKMRQPSPAEFALAVMHGDLARVKELLDSGMDPNGTSSGEHSYLMSAAIARQPDAAQLLLEAGAEVGLLEAVTLGDKETAQALLLAGEDPNLADANGAAALYWSVYSGHPGIAALLVAMGADVNLASERGHTPLMVAATCNDTETIALLIRNGAAIGIHEAAMLGDVTKLTSLLDTGADIETRSGSNRTPLMSAAAAGQVETMRVLLDRGADRDAESKFGYTPLKFAITGNHVNATELLLDTGSDINLRDTSDDIHRKGSTPLHWSVNRSIRDGLVCSKLIERGADIEAASDCGHTPLYTAVSMHNPTAAEILLTAGANINCTDIRGWTPLIRAAFSRYDAPLVKLLIQWGASLDITDENGKTALMHASAQGNLATVELLIDSGANLDAVDKHGASAIGAAALGGYVKVVELLKAHGAKPAADPLRDLIGPAFLGFNDVVKALREDKS